MRRLCAVLAAIALLGAACGGDDDEATTTATTGGEQEAAAESVTVEVDGKADDFAMGTLAYFPDAVTLHAGDTVRFHSNDTGEPHTVTLGTIVDKGLKAFNELPDEVKNADGPPDPSKLTDEQKALVAEAEELEKLPHLLPEGPGDANQLAANPCFAADLPADTDQACPKAADPPAFDGTHAVYNSGYLPGDEVFEVKLADDLAPGTYNYFCLLHRQGMTGTITVLPEGQKAQTAEEVEQAGEKKLEEFVAELRPQAELLERTSPDKPVAGAPPADGEGAGLPALVVEFGPKEVSVPTGKAVTWAVFGPHTVSFNVPQDAVGAFTKAPDGTWHANQKAFAPAGGPGAPPPPEGEGGPPDPDAKPILIDGGSFDGSAFKSSGFVPSFGPPGYQYKVTFTKPGTYKVQCLIHPDMDGTVKVT